MTEPRVSMRQLRAAVLVIGALAILLVMAVLWPRETVPPEIQGALLQESRPIPDFQLADHKGASFSGKDLQGQWHLVSYGYTHCPDICPTTLYEVSEFRQLLDAQPAYTDLQVLFYTVDPKRDTLSRLADYVPWFHETFKGLRAPSQAEATAFETGLGIVANVEPSENDEEYQVAHGLMLYLLNEKGELQAALKPTREMDGSLYYEPQKLLKDYLAIRQWRHES